MKTISTWMILLLIAYSSNAQNYGWYPVPGAPVWGRYDDINFINDSIAWIGQNDTVYKTTDRGNTWSVVFGTNSGMFEYLRSMDFVNDTLGFAGCLMPFNNNYFYRTGDGGQSWIPIDSLLPGPTTGFCGIDHKDNKIVAVGSINSPAYAIISNDYGATWTYHDLSMFSACAIDCKIIDSLNIIVSGSSTAQSNYRGNILRSSDGGLTWNQVAISATASTFGWKIFLQDNGIGLVSNEDLTAGFYFKTIDGGNTWQEHSFNGSSVNNVGGIAVINDTLMFTGNQHNYGMSYSTNGGSTWNDINVGLAINRIYVFNDNTAIASGATIYKYHPDSIFTSIPVMNQSLHTFELRSDDQKVFTLYANLTQRTKVMVELFTINGKFLSQTLNAYYDKGKHLFELPTQSLSSGGYFIRIRTYEFLTGIVFTKN